ncbi:glycosyltransferase [Candidatus Pacearchaeota archaeon]|nr:glycosyltransferase [Candidatus Pacearchaeota archaeon]
MKTAMVFPSRKSEKAISGYSVFLTEALRKNKVDAYDITYEAGKPQTLFKKIKELKKYDVIHLQHEYNLLGWYGLPFFLLYFLLSSKKCRIITTMHTALSQKEKFKGNKIKIILRRLLYLTQNRIINKYSDKIIVHANFFKDILSKEYNVSKRKIEVLPQGIIEQNKLISKDKAKKELNLSGKIYLIIGNFIPDHGADIIIRHAKEIGKTILIVINPKAINDRNQKRLNAYLNYCTAYVQKNKIQNKVRFDILDITDKKPEWWKYFSAADLVLQPYRGGIGSGIFAHAMTTKTPVVTSNILFFKEISDRYGCLKIVENEEDYAKAIKEAMKPANYNKMKKECARYSKENSWNEISKKYKKIYTSILQN